MVTQQLMLNGDCANIPEVVGSNPTPATNFKAKKPSNSLRNSGAFSFLLTDY
jgi:hypothetical protein